jgi:thiamine biosynthesis lipoprotein
VSETSAELRFDAIGAPWQIETPEPLSSGLVSAIHERVETYDATWSRFRADSLVTRVAASAGSWEFPEDAAPLFAFYRRLYDATGGAVTPLVGRRLEDLGYDSNYRLTPRAQLTAVPRWDDVMTWDGRVLTTAEPVVLDVGAAGKGYLVDIVAGLLRDAGHDEYVVDGSGDMARRGQGSIRIGLEHPFDPTLAIGVRELGNEALCASAPGRRTWGTGLHHILDGLTGEPTTAVAATWAVAATGLEADGLATALFFTSGDTLGREFDFEYVRMFPDSRVEHSSTWAGELFT